MGEVLIWRSEWPIWEQQEYMEKRQLFLRSYHFSRKQSRFGVRFRRFVWVRLRSAKRLPRMLWYRLRAWYSRRRFHGLVQSYRPMICAGDRFC